MKRSVFDCFQRGFLTLRANFALVWMGVLQSITVTVLFVLSLLPPIVVVGGVALLSEDLSDAAALETWLAELGPHLAARLPAVALGLVASLLIGMVAILVWAWFEGGILGVLLAAERQAHPQAGQRSGDWQWFRTFSLREFSGWGGRNLWRFFWFFHLMLTAWMVLALVFSVLVLGAGLAFERWGGGAAVGLGCGGSIPFLFLGWVLAVWTVLAQPAVVLPEGGAWQGSVVGLRILGRRLGASSVVLLLVFVISIVVALGVMVAQWTSDLLVSDFALLRVAVYVISSLIQWLLSSAITVFTLGTFTALVASETAPPGASRPGALPDEAEGVPR